MQGSMPELHITGSSKLFLHAIPANSLASLELLLVLRLYRYLRPSSLYSFLLLSIVCLAGSKTKKKVSCKLPETEEVEPNVSIVLVGSFFFAQPRRPPAWIKKAERPMD
eukprot:6489734-Amphidinium_carterae.1